MAGQIEDLYRTEPLAARIERHAFDRLIMLSDGVFAIVITLSALEIHPPETWTGGWPGLLGAMGLPLLIYALSFAVTGFYWIGQRRTLVRLRRIDGWLTAFSLTFLAGVALIPTATKMLIAARAGSDGLDALILYFGLIVFIAAVQSVAWLYAAFVRDLLLPEVTRRYRWAHLVSMLATPVASCGLTLVAVNVGGWARWAAVAAILLLVTARRRVLDRWASEA